MSIVVPPSVRRWLVPASAALAVIGGGVAIGAITNAADPSLPPKSAVELLVDLQTARVDGMSGTVVARADLGLPPLPVGGPGSADLTSLIAGTHTLRVWYSGPDQARVALLGTLGETDVITNGSEVWTWSSKDNTATHRKLPATGDRPTPFPIPSAGASGLAPDGLAKMVLAALEPSTEVTTNGSASVAGRDAYELVLRPKDPASLIGSVEIAIDATEHVPLRLAVTARAGGNPAIEAAFTQISFDRPDASQFTFNPPPGATVVEADEATGPDHPTPTPGLQTPAPGTKAPGSGTPGSGAPGDARSKMAVVGSGWTSVFVAKAPAELKAGTPDQTGGGVAGLLAALPKVSGAWGSGSLLSTRLFTVLITDDGRILIGAVSPDRIYQAAADPAAQLGS
jgi:outer membrane lipoprotein-sorting protein